MLKRNYLYCLLISLFFLGFLCAALSLAILSICVYKKLKLHDFILENSLQLSTSGWILGTIIAIFLYIKANKAPVACLNICASTNSIIYNFWQGREINPRLGSLDIKIILLRASVIGLVIIVFLFFMYNK